MSDLTKCNHCHLQMLRHDAAIRGEKISVRSEKGWKVVYVVHKDGSRVKVVLFLELSKGCVC